MMDEKTLTALKGSIAKWEAIVAGTGEDLGTTNCALCRMFNSHIRGSINYHEITDDEERETNCEGCPVAKHTGQYGCIGTPYDRFDEIDNIDDQIEEQTEYKKAAQEELDFLRSLLPGASA